MLENVGEEVIVIIIIMPLFWGNRGKLRRNSVKIASLRTKI
jgi:hypothetical protein